MSLKVYVRQFSRVTQSGDKVVKVTYRGVSQLTRVIEGSGEDVIFDEVLEWPVAREVETSEEIRIDLEIYNRYFANRLLATYSCVLQRLVLEGAIVITDHMTDASNKLIKTLVSFEARYTPPPGPNWDTGLREDRKTLEESESEKKHLLEKPVADEQVSFLGLEEDERWKKLEWADEGGGGEKRRNKELKKKESKGNVEEDLKRIGKPQSERVKDNRGTSDEEMSSGSKKKSYRLPKRSLSHSETEHRKAGIFGRRKESKSLKVETTQETKPRDGTPRTSNAGLERQTSSEDDRKMLLHDVEQNIANIERNLSLQEKVASVISRGRRSKNSSPETPRKSSNRGFAGMKAVRSLVRLGRQRSKSSDDEERCVLKEPDATSPMDVPRPASACSTNSDAESTCSQAITESVKSKRLRTGAVHSTPAELKAQDFQVCITIIEARQLAGLNMDPVVCVQVGETKKYTSVKESTNCPYYNEYFVFDFHMAPAMLFDKIITLTVLQSRNILRSNKVLGSFKLDVATVWAQSEHQFYHKWALLTDPDDVTGGPKGYLKCDICVVGKGDAIKIPLRSDKDEDDIEGNLLLPDGVPAERQRARFVVRIYKADGLPKINSSIIANVKRAFTGDTKDLIDPYVQVSFAGLTGRTEVKKSTACPVWNEQIVFTEMFPPLCQRMKIQLRDNDAVTDTVIGTHYLDLTTVSNDGDKGFLPTFGPAYIYLYGSTRDGSVMDEHSSLNSGLGEGIAYRGRLLIAVRCQITDLLDVAPSEVEVENTVPIPEGSLSQTEEFLMFASVHEATMIERKAADKPVLIELSIGNAGNCLDGSSSSKPSDEEESDEESGPESVHTESSMWQSTTPPLKPLTNDKTYFYLPFWDDKPCLYVRSFWQDHRRRLYNSNALATIADKLEDGLNDVQTKIEEEDDGAEKRLKEVMEELVNSCSLYLSIAKASSTAHAPSPGRTKLDKERTKLCQREIDHMSNSARHTKAVVTKHSLKERYKTAHGFLAKLKQLIEDPQHSLPDVFVWMISGNRRIAYQRIPTRHLIYSPVDLERGKLCGTKRTLFLKLPGKKSSGPGGWAIQAKLEIYLWMGLNRHKKWMMSGVPKGYDMSYELRNIERASTLPPITLHYTEKQTFQLRAHMYQARSLIGSDSSGLSDPFARVIFGEHCRVTQVIDETLSPTWDELLIIDEVIVYGTKDEIRSHPPMVVIEIFDQDKVGKSEFIGRALAKPRVRMKEEPYHLPNLEWYDIFRGTDEAGELLAAFELIQFREGEHLEELTIPLSKEIHLGPDIGPLLPVPRGIRPTLAKYRLEVLFWGLRDLKRVHLLTVDRPRVDVEIAGHIVQSAVINSAKKNPNFANPVKYIDLELPEQQLYCPPITIRVVDCRSFGRFTLVGTHIIANLHRYMWTPVTKRDREAAAKKAALLQQQLDKENELRNGNMVPNDVNGWKSRGRGRAGNAVRIDGRGRGHLRDEHVHLIDNSESSPLLTKETIITIDYGTGTVSKLAGITKKEKTEVNKRRKQSVEVEEDDEENRDWWTKYFASLEAVAQKQEHKSEQESEDTEYRLQHTPSTRQSQHQSQHQTQVHLDANKEYEKRRTHPSFKSTSTAAKLAARLSPKAQRRKQIENLALLKMLSGELEGDFNGFREWLHTFELYRGKKTDDLEDESRVVGKFKGSLKLYRLPLPPDIDEPTIMGCDPQFGFFQGLPSNDPIHVLVRVYVVRACDLHPMDLNGKADPYIIIQLGNKKISDKENYISKQLNPVFGKCFEIEATFPQDSMLTVSVLDWDLVGSDDMIGETKIDLENRFYSRHRATCGLSTRYEITGYNQWRDAMKPTQILARLCKEAKLELPQYGPGKVKIGTKVFSISTEDEVEMNRAKMMAGVAHGIGISEEQLALAVLHQWEDVPKVGCKLVPEHIETRPLFNPEKPGIEQGKVEMWVDMFPMDMPLPGPPIDVSPRKPKSYELRVIIWNTDDVVLEDDAFFTGEKMSDIYVKGWLKGPEDTQCTDIHYRSLTGEGNFNWRFIFPFEYLVAEEKIVISRKESLFSWDETECKIPARLELQVWDADHFSSDDFLGAITLDLNRFPRGAKSSKLCTLDMLRTDSSVPMINIFKQRRVKGWWPFYIKKENEEMELTGKVEAEIHLLIREDAEKNPAGLGRNEPDPLEKPNRPDASFMWFLNPIKSIRYIIWHNYKWIIIKFFIFVAVAIFIVLFFYSIPGFTVKKVLGA